MTASALAVGSTVASGSAAAQKRGGRGQVDGEVDRKRPFTITPDGTDMRNASCMSSESAMQTYLTYQIQYCDSEDEEDATLYVIPDEARLAPDEVYEIRSVTPCRANDLQKVAFGPSNDSCN